MSSHERLLSPASLGAWRLRNRIAMAPMTRSRAGAGGVPTSLNTRYYAQRAGAGLIIAEAAQISPEAQGYLRTPGIHGAEQIRGWRAVTDAVHERGGTIVLQLWHVGRCTHPENRLPGTRGVAPSAIAAPGRIFTPSGLLPMPVPVALDRAGIEAIVADYGRAAANALDAGFDGVELHAANGYLIDQFLHSSSNLRTDEYGGSISNRCRLLRDVAARLAERVGADRVGVRLSPFGAFNGAVDDDPEHLFATAIEGLNPLGIAYLHVINVEVSGDRNAAHASVDAVAFARSRWRGSLIAAGGYTADDAEEELASGQADVVAFGRPFIANPDLVERIRSGRPWAEPQRATFYTEGEAGYTDYPAADPIAAI
ncbi:MAG: alkene reductase [Burkholderiales bacterium]|nr:alkene reductase [Burkholderiales bacterium]OJX06616.1 MAG: alkene reductase [Burkholderiales bacterium 70-64]